MARGTIEVPGRPQHPPASENTIFIPKIILSTEGVFRERRPEQQRSYSAYALEMQISAIFLRVQRLIAIKTVLAMEIKSAFLWRGATLAEGVIEPRTESALRAIRRLLRAAEMSERQLAASTGLTPSQLVVLQDVARHGETNAGSIATAVRFSQATVTNLVDRLVERGYVVRSRRERDRRQVWISITPDGRAALQDAPDTIQDQFRAGFEQLQDWEQAMLVAMLERLIGLFNADRIDAAPIIHAGRIDRAEPS